MMNMQEILDPAVQRWSEDHPDAVRAMTTFHEAGVRFGASASLASQLVGEVVGMPALRPADDIDLLVVGEDFPLALSLLPNASARIEESFVIPAGDKQELRFIADEAVGRVGDNTFQFMRPHTPLMSPEHCYHTAFTEQAAQGNMHFETKEGIVTLAHIWEAIALYGISQRIHGKNDAHNTATLLHLCRPGDDYVARRAEKQGIDNRVWEFIGHAGLITAQRDYAMAG